MKVIDNQYVSQRSGCSAREKMEHSTENRSANNEKSHNE